MMDPGEDSGASTSYPRLPKWEEALSLPDNQEAPDYLRAHVAKQLTILFNIGRPVMLSEKTYHSYIEPLALDVVSVGFCKALLEREDYDEEDNRPNQGFSRLPIDRVCDQGRGSRSGSPTSGVASPKYDDLIKRARSRGCPSELLSGGRRLEQLPWRLNKELKLAAPSSSSVRLEAKESMELTSSLRNE
ncbi:hypothetical protein ACLOJK_013078 [Asimina triloba]